MTNHEHEPIRQPQPKEPERLMPPDDLDPALLDAALTAMRRYAEVGRGYGAAFIAYLGIDFGLDPESDEEADFRDRYIGHYPDRWGFLRSRLDDTGWSQALALFKAEQGMWPDDVAWDQGVLWEHFEETYALVERSGGVYAFRR